MKQTSCLEDTILQNSKKEKIDNLNKPVSVKEIKSIIINLQKQKAPDLDGFTVSQDQTFQEEIILILYDLFQKIEAKGILPSSYYETSIILTSKPKTLQEKKTADYRFLMNIYAKIPNKILAN